MKEKYYDNIRCWEQYDKVKIFFDVCLDLRVHHLNGRGTARKCMYSHQYHQRLFTMSAYMRAYTQLVKHARADFEYCLIFLE